MVSRTQLVVTADDFGVNAARSAGILALASNGRLSHTTALVNGEVSREMIVRFVKERNEHHKHATVGRPPTFHCSIGLHFNITEGYPISNEAKASPDLVDATTGRFRGKAAVFLLLSALNPIPEEGSRYNALRDVIAAEFDAQLRLFLSMMAEGEAAWREGRGEDVVTPAAHIMDKVWVDGHHHVHVLAPVFEVMVNHALVGGMRLPHQLDLLMGATSPSDDAVALAASYFVNEDDCFGEPFWRRVSSLAASRRGWLQSEQRHTEPATTDGFFGLNSMGAACSQGIVLSSIEELSRSSTKEPTCRTVEIMTHVGYAVVEGSDPFHHDAFSKSSEREHELSVYDSIVLPQGVVLVTVDEVMDMRGAENNVLHFTTLSAVEAAEEASREAVLHAEGVGISKILSAEVAAYLASKRRVHAQSRDDAKAAAEATTAAFMPQHSSECAARAHHIEGDITAMLADMRELFDDCSEAVLSKDEGDAVCETFIEANRQSVAAAISSGKTVSYTGHYLK